ncbi:LytR family transcriptional regulator [Glaciihabitans sp. INWT7]|uniref:LCP family protein n=1 Tax=Glaciihabitans sp. INWT7 TaxID=2596912 RepID=UPI001627BC3D|nr:LCP family protein [Glaciihabitans sp. INWT7]QNE47128.1 LytR family transcriptional regulator [Glaciihabitans sp. INWT7]
MGRRSAVTGSRSSRPHAPIRHGRLHRSHPIASIAKVLAAMVAVVAVSGTAVGAFAVYGTVSNIKPGIHLTHAVGAKPAPEAPSVGPIDGEVNMLLAGTDTRTGQAGYQTKAQLAGSSGIGNNDVTMLLHVSADHTSATVVSFPRDMVNIPMCGRSTSPAMFNSTLSRGLSCTVQTVEKMTGLSIPYAGVITFDGVTGMSNAVGGVTVCLATPVKDPYTDPQLNLPAGQQSLVGAEALSFLRSRHGVGDGSDLGRISNQQVFLSALTRKITSDGVLSNPVTLYKLANAALSNVQLSDTLTNPTTLMSIALALKGIDLSNIVFVQYPTGADPANPNRVVPLVTPAAALATALQSDQPITLTGKLGRAAIADPTAPVAGTPAPTASTDPSASATPGPGSIALPSTISGQSADQTTCTQGFTNRK